MRGLAYRDPRNRHDAPVPPADTVTPPLSGRILTVVAAAGALVASSAGLLVDNPYPGPVSTGSMLQGYDIVNCLVVLAFTAFIVSARRSPQRALLARISLLAYLAYTYAYYVFGTGFQPLFLLHVVVFAAALAGLVVMVPQVDLSQTGPGSGVRRRTRGAAALLAILTLALCGMWVYYAIDNAITGDVPSGSRLVETEAIVHLGMALDLALLVPWYATASVLLWKGRPAGYAAAIVAVVTGLLHQLSYIVALPVQVAADVPGATAMDPAEPLIVLIYGVVLVLLLSSRNRPLQGANAIR